MSHEVSDVERLAAKVRKTVDVFHEDDRFAPATAAIGDDLALLEAAIRALRPTREAAPVDGLVWVPQKMYVDPENWESAQFAFGGPGTGEDEGFLPCTLWVGEIVGDEGEKTYGLHVSCDECPEEGSITLAEFAAAPTREEAPFAQGEQGAHVDAVSWALNLSRDWIENAPHGDDCFVSDHYEGDPGNRCNCGKDGALQLLDDADEAMRIQQLAAPSPAEPRARTCSDERMCINCFADQGECLGPYKQASPAEPVALERWGFPNGINNPCARCDDGYWTPWHLATAALAKHDGLRVGGEQP